MKLNTVPSRAIPPPARLFPEEWRRALETAAVLPAAAAALRFFCVGTKKSFSLTGCGKDVLKEIAKYFLIYA